MNPTSAQFLFRGLTVALLGYIAVTLHQIEAKTIHQPTVAEFMAARTPAEKKLFFSTIPLVRVNGSVDVSGTVDIGFVEHPVDVSIKEPLEVQISR